MKAVVVTPGKADTTRLEEIDKPSVSDIPDGRGVLVRILRTGVDATDEEVRSGAYGKPPAGEARLVIGHECIGVVESVGPRVGELRPGDLVVPTVRRPGESPYDRIGLADMSTDDEITERGISFAHGFLTEFFVDRPEFLIRIPPALREAGVLLEPMSIGQKGVAQAFEIQRRMRIWRPARAAVLGAGTIGLLAALTLRLRGLDVSVFARTRPPLINATLVDAIGGSYHSTRDRGLEEVAREKGPYDIIFEATGASALAFEAMNVLGKNGVLILSSVTGGDKMLEIPADRINLKFVLGNKVTVGTVNAGRSDFESGLKDLAAAEATWPGWLSRLLTHPVEGLDRYEDLFTKLEEKGSVKVYCDIGWRA